METWNDRSELHDLILKKRMANYLQNRIGTAVSRLIPPRHYHRHELSDHQMARMEGRTIKVKDIHEYTYRSHTLHSAAGPSTLG